MGSLGIAQKIGASCVKFRGPPHKAIVPVLRVKFRVKSPEEQPLMKADER
jgi:hypothetical protein